jgi:hypothetical protein
MWTKRSEGTGVLSVFVASWRLARQAWTIEFLERSGY